MNRLSLPPGRRASFGSFGRFSEPWLTPLCHAALQHRNAKRPSTAKLVLVAGSYYFSSTACIINFVNIKKKKMVFIGGY
ncbi:hypothetical protein [Adhaeribacter radiodurans]|uniref:Uncharacterized protein n=1 Tax=Adhaeribacter radiodurans TaxID=2745197 RepID=A0A7L7LA00_9BACT|nr:hypothetical protein [Adhaeribacter radiodurans]QMU29544.1 hypothetical protein HUW48_16540 [Adhaeribacter radiodurans]